MLAPLGLVFLVICVIVYALGYSVFHPINAIAFILQILFIIAQMCVGLIIIAAFVFIVNHACFGR